MHLKGNIILVVLAINSVGMTDTSKGRVEILAIFDYNPSKYGPDEAK